MTTKQLKQTKPTLSVRTSRQCGTCGRSLPQRAHRRICASCIKEAAGYRRMLKTQDGWRTWIHVWMSQAEYEAEPYMTRRAVRS